MEKKVNNDEHQRITKLRNNKEDLMKQMEERHVLNMNEDLMNRIDFKLNRKIINNLENPMCLPKNQRKPF